MLGFWICTCSGPWLNSISARFTARCAPLTPSSISSINRARFKVASLSLWSGSKILLLVLTCETTMLGFWICTCSGPWLNSISARFTARCAPLTPSSISSINRARSKVASFGLWSRSKVLLLTCETTMLGFWTCTCAGPWLSSIAARFAASPVAPRGISSMDRARVKVALLGLCSRSKVLTVKTTIQRFWIGACSGPFLSSTSTRFAASTICAPLGISSIDRAWTNIALLGLCSRSKVLLLTGESIVFRLWLGACSWPLFSSMSVPVSTYTRFAAGTPSAPLSIASMHNVTMTVSVYVNFYLVTDRNTSSLSSSW